MIWKTKVGGADESTCFAERVEERIFFAGGAPLQWRVLFFLAVHKSMKDAPLEWRAPSKD